MNNKRDLRLSYKYSFLFFILSFFCWELNYRYALLIQLFFVGNIIVDFKRLTSTKNVAGFIKAKRILSYYTIWVTIMIVIGMFMARNYYEYKHLVQNSCSALIPLTMLVFFDPTRLKRIYRFWYRYAFLVGLLLILFSYLSFSQFYFSPILLLTLFISLFRRKMSVAILLISVCYIIAGYQLDAREQILMGFATLSFGCLAYFHRHLSYAKIRIIKYLCYGFTLFFFIVALPNFNSVMNKSDTDMGKTIGGGKDTRSLLYLDVITSAINNNYYIWGRSPARGNDVVYSGVLFMISDDDGYYDDTELVGNERTANEICFANVFTWFGLIGLFLYFAFYFVAISLATKKSNNVYIKLLGCFIAFRWSMGWIADMNNFDISSLSLWAMIAMCFSPVLRNMNNDEFKQWIRGII